MSVLRSVSRQTVKRLIYLSRHASTEAQGHNLNIGNEGETHFGFQKVRESEKSGKVHEVFENVAQKYDVMNDAMSLGIHRIWKDIFMCRLSPTEGTKLIDVAGGTGFLTGHCKLKEHLRKIGIQNDGSCRFYGEGEETAAHLLLSCDAITNKRNCSLGKYQLQETELKLLTPQSILKFIKELGLFGALLYDQYSFQMIPVLGHIIAGQWEAYQYLVESIRQFPNQEKFKALIEEAGFKNVEYENLTLGIVAIHSGFKL